MGAALNTTVNGSTGTCVRAADWLRSLAEAGHRAGDEVRGTRTDAEAGWQGPAGEAFRRSITNIDVTADDLAGWASRCEHGLRDFAGALDTVIARMHEAINRAKASGLRIDGPFIVEPDPVPMSRPGTPMKVCTATDLHRVIGTYQGDIGRYNALVAEYNAKVAAYNECKSIVDAARNAEGNAHHALQEAVRPVRGGNIDAYTLGTFTLARVNGYIRSFENPRMENLLKAKRVESHARFFENWANGTTLDLSEADRKLLQEAAEESRGNRDDYRTRAAQFEKWVRKVPEPVRKMVAAYPGKSKVHLLPPEAGAALRTGQKLLRGMPYVGSALTAGTEIFQAAQGEQSWGKAAADSGGLILGGALGAAGASAAAAAVYGAPLGPVGALVTGTVGGIVGAIGGQAVADYLVPK